MAELLREACGSLEVLEVSDEGKKKSKYKGFKNFFGKKKEKECEDAPGGGMLKPSLSIGNSHSSSLKLTETRAKSSMGNKALSHDSIFMLEPEPERSASKSYPFPKPHRGRMLQISPLYLHQPSISPPLIRPDTISEDFEEIPIDDMSPKSSQNKVSFHTILTVKKVKPKQEEPILPMASEEKKSTTKQKEGQEQSNKAEICDKKPTDEALNDDSAVSQGYPMPEAYGRQCGRKGSSALGMSECGTRGRSLKQSSQGHDPEDGAGSPPAKKTARDCPLRHLPFEKQFTEQPTTPPAEKASPQEVLSDKDGVERRNPGVDFEAKESSAPQPIPGDMKESMVSDLPPYHEDGASGVKKTEARAPLSQVVESPSTTQEDIHSMSLEAQVFMDAFHNQSEEEDDSGLDSTNAQFKMESSQDILTICKEKSRGNVLPAFTTSASGTESAVAEGDISEERLPPRSVSQALQRPEDGQQVSSDSVSTSEEGSGFEEHLTLGHSSRSLGKPEDEQEVFPESQNLVVEFSSSEQQVTPGPSSQSLGRPEDCKKVSDSESALEEMKGSEEQLTPTNSFQSLEKPEDEQEVFSESKSFVGELSDSEEQLAPGCPSQALGEPSDKEVSTEPNICTEKSNNAEEQSNAEEALPPRHPFQALGKPEDQQEVSSVSEYTPENLSVSMEQLPPRCPSQPFTSPVVQQQVSSGSASTSAKWNCSLEPVSPSCIFQSWVNPEFEQDYAGPESAAVEWGISMEPLPPRIPSKHLRRSKSEQQVSSSPEIATAEGIISMDLLSPGHHSQPLTRPTVEEQVSTGPEIPTVQGSIYMEPLPPKCPFPPQVSPKVKQQVSTGRENTVTEESISMEPLSPRRYSEPLMKPIADKEVCLGSLNASAEGSSSMELLPPRCPFQAWMNPKFEQQVSAGRESTAINLGISVELIPPRIPSRPLMIPKVEPQDSSASVSASAKRSSMQLPLPRCPLQPWVRPKLQQVSTGPEGTAVERSNYMELQPPRHHPQSLIRPVVEQEVSSGSVSSAAELIGPMETLPPRPTFQSRVNPEVQQQDSASLESAVAEGGISMELLPPKRPSQSLIRYKIQQISSSFEGATVDAGISGKSLPPRYPAQFISRSKVQEMSSCLENPVVEDISKKSLLPRHPSQSFKFMAQQIFSCSESPAIEGGIYMDPLPQNHPSKSLLRPRVEQQVFSGSESAPAKWSSSKEQLPSRHLIQALEKREHQQEISSVSGSFREEWWSSEEQHPSRPPSQALDGSEFQPQIFPMGSVSVPAEKGHPEEQLPPRHPFQAFGNPENQQQVYSSSMSATAEGITSENNPGSCPLSRGPASSNKTRKASKDSEDGALIKSNSTLATKFVKFAITPACQTSLSRGPYCKEEVLESGDQNNNSHSRSSTNGSEVENLFGVRLKRIPFSQRYKDEKQDSFTELPLSHLSPISSSISKEQQVRRGTFQRCPGISENITVSDLAEKQQVRPKSEDMAKKQPAYNIPEKAPDQQPGLTTMAKERQRSFQAQVPVKKPITKKIAGAKSEAKEHQYGGADLVNQYQPRMSLISSIYRQEKMAKMNLPKSTKAVEFDDEKIFQVPTMKGGTRRSSSLPAGLHELVEPTELIEPIEPVWFSLAKKKAKAWSQIAEIMQ